MSPCLIYNTLSLNLPLFLEFIGISPRRGTKIFKYKQSSDCRNNWERSSCSCRSLCFGIRFTASARPFSLLMSTGNRWGQTGPWDVACKIPSHGFGALVGCHLEGKNLYIYHIDCIRQIKLSSKFYCFYFGIRNIDVILFW